MTLGDLVSVAKHSFSAFGKAFFNDGLHMGMTIGRNVSVKGRLEEFQGAMYSAILDHKVCSYCASLDGLKLKLTHPEFKSGKYHPPQHKHCRCVWIYIHKDEPEPTWNWDKYKPDSVSATAHYHNQGSNLALAQTLGDLINKTAAVFGVSKVFELFNGNEEPQV